MATFRKLKSGRWQARVSRDGKEFSIGTFRTKKEAEIEAAKVEERIYYGQALSDRHMLFADVVNEWLFDHKKSRVKDPTFVHMESVVRNHITPHFAHKKIMSIRRSDIRKWLKKYADMKDKEGNPKYAYNTRKNHLTALNSVLNYAVTEIEVLEKNPAARLSVPAKDSVEIKKEVKYYSLEERDKLLDYMRVFKHQRFSEYRLYYMLMYFLSETGLRISEALAVRWTDIVDGKLTVDRQTSRDNSNQLKLTTLKNVASYRTIKLQDGLLRELKLFKLKQEEMISKYETFERNEHGIIFQNYRGDYLTPKTIRDSIKTYCKNAGVDYKGTHVFRHTHAVLLLESGASIKFVADRLGHESTATTTDTYLDITDKIETDELDKYTTYTSKEI